MTRDGGLTTTAAIGIAAPIATALLLCAGCYQTYAPPVRTGHMGAPPRSHAGRMEIGGSFSSPLVGEGSLGYSVADSVQVEVGGGGGSKFALGFAGLRVEPFNRPFAGKQVKLTFDLEGGGGAGVGGEHCWKVTDAEGNDSEECDGVGWRDRAAGGGYLGLGVGLNVAWFDLFVRERVQITAAQDVPPTLWSTSVLGAQATIVGHVKLYIAGGYWLYDNLRNTPGAANDDGFWLAELGLSVQFDTVPTKDAAKPEKS